MNLYGQKKKEPNPKKEVGLLLENFSPREINSVLKLPGIRFHNINKVAYYYDKKELKRIYELEKNKDWEGYLKALYQYISNFGVNNFVLQRDMDLVWRLARVSEYFDQTELTKELYRLILKHYRGDVQDALYTYDSLIKFEKPLYADLEYYYRLVEKRLQIDTLKPPKEVLTEMGSEINSHFDEYGMTIGGKNDSQLIFTSKRVVLDTSTINKDLYGERVIENIYSSQKNPDGTWQEAKPFDGINTQYNEGSPCISKDGKTIFFVRCHAPDGSGDCDLYTSSLQEDGTWSEATNLGPKINSYAWDSHPALNMTEDTLYFSSARKGGFGGLDIWYTTKDKKGEWEECKNVGPVINSMRNEVSPYPHAKHHLLYFSSDGQLLNFGGYDIFKSYVVEGEWTEPKNVGPLVNGEGNEFYFAIDSQSKWLFYAKSYEQDAPNMDLQSFPLPMEAKPNNLVRFSGRIIEKTTGEVFQGVVTIIDLTDGIEVAPRKIREDGSFDFELINKKKYLLVVEGDNFFRIEEMFYLDGDKEVQIPAVSINSVLTFKSIDFEKGSARLLPGMENNLHLVIDFLAERPKYRLRVTGHTDSDGDPTFNLTLSKRRAEAIRGYILSYGNFHPSRVIADGKGDTEPIIPNPVSDEEKRINRRVEFKIYFDEYGIAEPLETDPEKID
ncbi:OmpA family protein [Limibacter armeniacum]|uniref:OmpA family protein n=1 Tax=Limibacter armeniacum TaxID=466084 RepID=UPI002FE65F38